MIEMSEKEANQEMEEYHRKNSKLRIYFGEQSHEVFVFANDRIIGLIQELNINVIANSGRSITIVFPELNGICPDLEDPLKRYTKDSQFLPDVNIVFRPLSTLPLSIKKEMSELVCCSSEDDFQKSLNMVTDAKES